MTVEHCVSVILLSSILFVFLVSRKRTLKESCNVFLISLILSQLMNTVTLLVAIITGNSSEDSRRAGSTSDMNIVFANCLLCVTMNLCLVTLDRYLSLKLHLRYLSFLTVRRMMVSLAAAWSFPVFVALVTVVVRCYDTANSKLILVATLTTTCSVAVLFLASTNVYIFLLVRRHVHEMRRSSVTFDNFSKQLSTSRFKERRTSYMILVLVLSYSVCVLPSIAHSILALTHQSSNTLEVIARFLLGANSILDALCYVFIKKDLRTEYIRVMCRRSKVDVLDTTSANLTSRRTTVVDLI